jgi:hypothetical protein
VALQEWNYRHGNSRKWPSDTGKASAAGAAADVFIIIESCVSTLVRRVRGAELNDSARISGQELRFVALWQRGLTDVQRHGIPLGPWPKDSRVERQ